MRRCPRIPPLPLLAVQWHPAGLENAPSPTVFRPTLPYRTALDPPPQDSPRILVVVSGVDQRWAKEEFHTGPRRNAVRRKASQARIQKTEEGDGGVVRKLGSDQLSPLSDPRNEGKKQRRRGKNAASLEARPELENWEVEWRKPESWDKIR